MDSPPSMGGDLNSPLFLDRGAGCLFFCCQKQMYSLSNRFSL